MHPGMGRRSLMQRATVIVSFGVEHGIESLMLERLGFSSFSSYLDLTSRVSHKPIPWFLNP